MQDSHTHSRKPDRRNLTVAGLRAFKAKRIFSQIAAYAEADSPAAAAAGVDTYAIDRPLTAGGTCERAPEASTHTATGPTACRSEPAMVEAAFDAKNDGADALYTPHSLPMVPKPTEF